MSVILKEFYADWCGPCDQQDEIVDELEDEHPEVTVRRIDVETNTGEVNRYAVRSLPTIVVESDDGGKKRFTGVTDIGSLKQAIKQLRQ